MNNYNKLKHTTWECKYHLIWIPKYRKKTIYGQLRKYFGEILKELALQKESKIIEGHLMGDHVHVLISIPAKYSVSQVVGYIKGKSAIHIAKFVNMRKVERNNRNQSATLLTTGIVCFLQNLRPLYAIVFAIVRFQLLPSGQKLKHGWRTSTGFLNISKQYQ